MFNCDYESGQNIWCTGVRDIFDKLNLTEYFENKRCIDMTSLQCYTVLSTIAQLLRKMKLKNLVSLFLMSYLSETLE